MICLCVLVPLSDRFCWVLFLFLVFALLRWYGTDALPVKLCIGLQQDIRQLSVVCRDIYISESPCLMISTCLFALQERKRRFASDDAVALCNLQSRPQELTAMLSIAKSQ